MNVARRILLLVALLLTTIQGAVSQTTRMVNHDTVYDHCCRFTEGVIMSDRYIADYYDQWAIIYPHGRILDLFISHLNCELSIWRDGALLYNSSNTVTNWTLRVLGNAITIRMYKNPATDYNVGATISWHDISGLPSSCSAAPSIFFPHKTIYILLNIGKCLLPFF